MSHIHVRSPQDARGLEQDLRSLKRLGLDCEAAGFHRYSDRLCLVQLSTDRGTYVIDPLGFDPSGILRAPLESPTVKVVMHGADFDLRLLQRDLGIRVQGLFDTQIAAQLLGEDGLGLAALLESRLDVRLSKKYQRADWAERPLSDAMLEYAADDTRHLLRLADAIEQDLAATGRSAWVAEECRALEAATTVEEPWAHEEDPVVRVKGARHLTARQVAALREALSWRDEIARTRDRAPFRVIGDRPLIEAVALGPRAISDLIDIKGFPVGLARQAGGSLLRRLDTVRRLPEGRLEPYPQSAGRGPGRPPPDVVALADRLKRVRNRKSDELGLARGTLLSNAVVLEVARTAPQTLDALAAVEGMRRWKADVLGQDLLDVIQGAPRGR